MFNQRTKINKLLAGDKTNFEATVMGWVRTFRNNQFIALNDGSTNNNLQVLAELGKFNDDLLKRITTGACIKATGEIIPSLGKGQKIELKASSIEILGDSDAEKFPLQPKKHSLEFLREIAHLRFRTNTFGSVFRIRHSLAFAVHKFFNDKGFVYMHTPVITASDAEGAGEMFKVTTIDLTNPPVDSSILDIAANDYYERILKIADFYLLNSSIDNINSILKTYQSKVEEKLDFEFLVKAKSYKLTQIIELINNENLNNLINQVYEKMQMAFFVNEGGKYYFPDDFIKNIRYDRSDIRDYKVFEDNILKISFYNYRFIDNQLKLAKDRKVNYKEDFFGRSTNLTVSGQLEGELAAMAFSEIYTFGPTFRAENSNTTRHLAEFWMIEPEMAFYDLEDNANLAEEFIQYIIKHAMENNREDLEFLAQRLAEEEKALPQDKRSELGLIEKLEFVLNNKFERLTYTEAIEILKESNHNKKKKFQYPITGWGMDLQSEHERYLVEKHFKKPVILTNYPAAIKAFYMRQDDNCAEGRQTVSAMDILAPGIGEIVGGSQREERLDRLEKRMQEMHIPTEELYWYLDTRRFGACPHAGFGLGFERMVQFVTGMGNIRDVIPFPRYPKSAEF